MTTAAETQRYPWKHTLLCVCVHIFGRASTCPSPAGSGDVARVKHLLAAVNTEQRLTSFTLFDGSAQLSSVQAKSLVSTGKRIFPHSLNRILNK